MLLFSLCILSCNSSDEKVSYYDSILIASQKYYVCDGESGNIMTRYLCKPDNRGWTILPSMDGLDYEIGYEYRVTGYIDWEKDVIVVTKVHSKEKKKTEGIDTYNLVSKEVPVRTPCRNVKEYQ